MITSADEATEAAETLGYPLVAKACPTVENDEKAARVDCSLIVR
jgi:hypothetical protein